MAMVVTARRTDDFRANILTGGQARFGPWRSFGAVIESWGTYHQVPPRDQQHNAGDTAIKVGSGVGTGMPLQRSFKVKMNRVGRVEQLLSAATRTMPSLGSWMDLLRSTRRCRDTSAGPSTFGTRIEALGLKGPE
jgi:hypothetical protein